MNMWTKSQRRWRKSNKRGVSPIIATILLVAITVVLAAVLYILISGLTKGPGNTPLGTALALGTPSESQGGAGNTHFYNFSVQSAGGGIQLSNMQFQVQTAAGTVVTSAGTWSVTAIGVSGASAGVYSFTTNSWTSGGTTVMNSGQQLVLLTPTATSLSGDNLIVVGTGSYSGTISVAIP